MPDREIVDIVCPFACLVKRLVTALSFPSPGIRDLAKCAGKTEKGRMAAWREECPAKLNLFLAVGGRRADGYHELLSLAAPVTLADALEAEESPLGADELSCDNAELSAGPDNLVLKAAAAYRAKVPGAPHFRWKLCKRIPWGAGLGGGSSDAAGALRILNAACAGALDAAALSGVAASVGSDCPLFLIPGPVLMRGRGEKVEPLPEPAAAALRGRRVALVKPHFSIPTGWAYGALDRAGPGEDLAQAGEVLARWIERPEGLPPLFNSFQKVAFGKYLAYDELNRAVEALGFPPFVLTGSGSAVFSFPGKADASVLRGCVEDCLGAEAGFFTTALL